MGETKNFVLIGAAGYVAPRHMEAIKEVGGNLVAVFDPHDAVGIIDRYFPDAKYFSEFERFDRFCERYQSLSKIDYVSICSPNYLHSSHCLFALRLGADAICEKPLVLKEKNVDQLLEAEQKYGGRVWTILQMRLHPNVAYFYAKMSSNENAAKARRMMSIFSIDYVTPRGMWYLYSWKGNEEKSGGLASNIGIHLFDFVSSWFKRDPDYISIETNTKIQVSGSMEYFKRDDSHSFEGLVSFNLSIFGDRSRVFRYSCDDITIDIDTTSGFEQLHISSYENIINGKGFGIEDARPGVKLCESIRKKKPWQSSI